MKRYQLAILSCVFLSTPLLADNLSHWQKLANNGSANAQFNLGVMYANGEGVEKNVAEAASWYQKAAFQGDYRSQYNLGALYANAKVYHKILLRLMSGWISQQRQESRT